MLPPDLYKLLIKPEDRLDLTSLRTQASVRIWLGLSLVCSMFYSILGMLIAFSNKYVVQDDAREYVFWMQRFIDPTLLPNDLIADYFTSVTPSGYAAIYRFMADLGVTPLLFSKLLPTVLGLVMTVYCFGVCLQIFPVPLAGFIASLLLNQSLWFTDDLFSAIPRSFIYPLFLAFLYYLLQGSWLWVCLLMVLQGLIYPPLIFISSGVLLLRLWRWKSWMVSFDRRQCGWLLLAVVLGFVTVIPYAIASSQFGPTVTAAEARTMPELWVGGRHPFFDSNPLRFWFAGQHSRILPLLLPPLIWTGVLLPWLLRRPSRFPLIHWITPQASHQASPQTGRAIALLSEIVAVSFGLYIAAHLLLLKLFFPSRYTGHTLRIVMALAAGIVLTTLIDRLLRQPADAPSRSQRKKARALIAALVLTLFFYPLVFNSFPKKGYKVSVETELNAFLQTQPKQTLVASLSEEASHLPTFAQRSVLVSREHALPFHLGYYRQIRQRYVDLIAAQYSETLAAPRQVIQKYGIDFWLLDNEAFAPDYLTNGSRRWLRSYQPMFDNAVAGLKQGEKPALQRLVNRCAVVKGKRTVLLSADCIIRPRRRAPTQ